MLWCRIEAVSKSARAIVMQRIVTASSHFYFNLRKANETEQDSVDRVATSGVWNLSHIRHSQLIHSIDTVCVRALHKDSIRNTCIDT